MQDSEVISCDADENINPDELPNEDLTVQCRNLSIKAQEAQAAKEEMEVKMSELEQKIADDQGRADNFLGKIRGLEAANQHLNTQLGANFLQTEAKDNRITELSQTIEVLRAEAAKTSEDHESQRNGFVEELNKMNEALKQRGEVISKLEDKCKLATSELQVEIDNLKQVLSEKDRRIEQLEGEVNRCTEQSETMSTSTVSKAEEIHRMKDVEESLEDRYNKLRMLAVKMKKRIAEQAIELQEKEAKLATVIKPQPVNIQALQKDIDRLNDELDLKKSELSALKKDFENCVQELAKSKEAAEEHKNEASVVKAALANLDKLKVQLEKSVQELGSQVDLLGQEKETEKIMRQELGKECELLKKEVGQLNATISELNRSQEEQRSEFKRQNHLQLEISDYERLVTELDSKINSLNQQRQEDQNLMAKYKESNEALNTQLELLEAQIRTEQGRADGLKIALDEARSQLNQMLEKRKEQEAELRRMQNQSESRGSELDDLRLQLAMSNAELQKAQTGSAIHLDSLRKQVNALENRLSAELSEKSSVTARLAEVQKEFDSYKVRAASVLKKKAEGLQQTNGSQETANGLNTEKVEREMLQRVVEALKVKITELESQLSLTQGEVTSLRADKEHLIASEARTTKSLEQRLQQAVEDLEHARKDHQTTLLRLNGDSQLMASLHREQMDRLKERHSEEMQSLQGQIDLASSEIQRLQKVANNVHRSLSPQVKSEGIRNDYGHVEREQAEGCEDVRSDPHYSSVLLAERTPPKPGPIPLDQLLNSPMVLDDPAEDAAESTVSEDQVQQLNELLSVSEKRCRHVAALLAESEANEARLSQLTEALKEEIRRSERSEERQKHIENLEYLKNVILKFVTLPLGEERCRLVPVLSTLLRLSPSEIQDLNRAFDTQRSGSWSGVLNNFWAPV